MKQAPPHASPELDRLLAEAVALHQGGKPGEAKECYQKILAAHPGHFGTLNLLAVASIQTGEAARAIPLLERALLAQPDYVEAHSNLGAAFRLCNRAVEAEAACRKALALRPDYPEALHNLGAALQLQGRDEEALVEYGRSLVLRPASAQVHNSRCVSLKRLRRHEEAVEAGRRALALQPHYAEALNNVAAALKELGRYGEALAACEEALALQPNFAEAHGNRGVILASLNRMEEAAAAYRQALDHRPDFNEVGWNLGLMHLSLGRFAEGWVDYERRWGREEVRALPETGLPLWTGEPGIDLAGKKLLIQFEQGCGDLIQMARYLPLLERRGAVPVPILEVPASLRTLLTRSFPDLRLTPLDVVPEGLDYRIPVMSLPLALGTDSEAAIPGGVPYLRPDPEAVARWAARLPPDPRRKFGLVWRGNPIHPNDRNRSAKLEDLLPLLARKDVIWFILQKNLTEAELLLLQPFRNAVVLDPVLETFDDTAAVMMFLNVVVSVDSAPAHLAGALGRKTAVLLPFHADWRWMHDRADSPWYPSARLYRQAAPGDWAGVVGRLLEEI